MPQVVVVTNPTFQPAMRVIGAITNNDRAEITTSTAHDYATGMIVRIIVPWNFGMTQINQLQAEIAVTGDTTFTCDIDTRDFDVFVIPPNQNPPDGQIQYAQVVPVGEINELLSNATRNVLPYQ
jgi:hypothetical protein